MWRGAIAFWGCERAIAVGDDGVRSLFGGCGGAIAFWGVGVRSLFGMWEGDSEALLQAVRCYNKNSYSFLEKTLWN